MPKFTVGQTVKWEAVKREGKKKSAPIKCTGKIKSVKMSVFGGSRKGMGAMITVNSKTYRATFGKSWAFVSFDKLEAV